MKGALLKRNRKQLEAQYGVPDWLVANLGLPDTTQRVVLVASNRDFLKVSVKFYALKTKGGAA